MPYRRFRTVQLEGELYISWQGTFIDIKDSPPVVAGGALKRSSSTPCFNPSRTEEFVEEVSYVRALPDKLASMWGKAEHGLEEETGSCITGSHTIETLPAMPPICEVTDPVAHARGAGEAAHRMGGLRPSAKGLRVGDHEDEEDDEYNCLSLSGSELEMFQGNKLETPLDFFEVDHSFGWQIPVPEHRASSSTCAAPLVESVPAEYLRAIAPRPPDASLLMQSWQARGVMGQADPSAASTSDSHAQRSRASEQEHHSNPGSFGHPELCQRPCLYAMSETCLNGEHCEFCHFEHTKRPPHLDKKQRRTLSNMKLSASGALLLPPLRKKVLAVDNAHEVDALILDLARLYGFDFDDESQLGHRQTRQERMLISTLSGMSVRLLLMTIQRLTVDTHPEISLKIEELMSFLRRGAPTILANHDPEAHVVVGV